ncbi:MAG: NAD(P)H-hydrate dehydratase [Chloroflexi bacterium]|nr:NAD(P)H-hydrate dehydratase [Chloroflexota bacterium]
MPERARPGFGRALPADPAPDLPPELDDLTAASLLPVRATRGHKGLFGKLLVIAGSLDYAGAAILVARSAGRAGAGLVTLAVPESLQPLFASRVLEATTMALPEGDVEDVQPDEALARILDHDHDALVVGPGLRPGLATTELIRSLLATPEAGAGADPASGPPVLLDAEALRSLASLDGWWHDVPRRAVMTPHLGEFSRLRSASGQDPTEDGDLVADDGARAAATADAARVWGQVVVLKGARTVIADPSGEIAVAPFENPALASAGTGDVLSGTIGSLLAQGLAPFAAARLGVHLHGLAGEAVRARIGDAGLLASDLIDEIALARRRLALLAERRGGRRVGFAARDEGETAGS